MGAGIEPRSSAPQSFNLQLSELQVGLIHVGYFELSPGRRADLSRNVYHSVVIEVESGNRVVGAGSRRLFLDPDRLALSVEFNHPIRAGVGHVIAEDRGTGESTGGTLQRVAQLVTIENVVAKNQTRGISPDELSADEESLGEAVR